MIESSQNEIENAMMRKLFNSEPCQLLLKEKNRLESAIEAEPTAGKKTALAVELKAVLELLDQNIHEWVVLPTHKEVSAEFSEWMEAGVRLAQAWSDAWYGFQSLHAGQETFPQIDCRNTAIRKIVRG